MCRGVRYISKVIATTLSPMKLMRVADCFRKSFRETHGDDSWTIDLDSSWFIMHRRWNICHQMVRRTMCAGMSHYMRMYVTCRKAQDSTNNPCPARSKFHGLPSLSSKGFKIQLSLDSPVLRLVGWHKRTFLPLISTYFYVILCHFVVNSCRCRSNI